MMVEGEGKTQTHTSCFSEHVKNKMNEIAIRVLRQEDASSDSTLQNKAGNPTNILIYHLPRSDHHDYGDTKRAFFF